jgi:predicted AAA+ superfamily ATPase
MREKIIKRQENMTEEEYEDLADTILEDIMFDEKKELGQPLNEWTNGYTQWLVQGDTFVPIQKSINQLPAGFYNFAWNQKIGSYIPLRQTINIEKLLIFPDMVYSAVLDDIRRFWENKETYSAYDYVYKRGILLYGKPGCGKSSLIMLLAKELIDKYNGVIFNLRGHDDIDCFTNVMKDFREIEPERPIIVIIEDIDNFTINNNNQELVTMLLNILDGASQLDNVVTIATTNHPDKLEERIANRPSRFDRRYEIGPPNAENREFYLKTKLKEEDLVNMDINDFIKKTEGFTLDHLKELLLSIYVLGYDKERAIEEITDMHGSKILKNTSANQGMGFKK